MATVIVPPSGIRLAPCLYFARQTATGEFGGYHRLRGPIQLSLNPNVDRTVIRSQECDTFGQILGSIVVPGDFEISITTNWHDAISLTLPMLGDRIGINEAAVVGQNYITNAFVDSSVFLPHINVGNISIPTLTLGTDYNEDLPNGRIDFLNTAAVAGLTNPITITYDVATAYTGDQVNLFTNTIIRGALYAQGVNQFNGRKIDIFLRQVSLGPDGEQDFMNEDGMEVSLTGLVETPTGQTDPGWIKMY